MAAGAGVDVVGIIHRQVVRRQQLGALCLRVEVRALERAQLLRRVAAVAHCQADERDHLLLQRLVERAQAGHAAVGVVHAAAVLALIFRALLRDLLAGARQIDPIAGHAGPSLGVGLLHLAEQLLHAVEIVALGRGRSRHWPRGACPLRAGRRCSISSGVCSPFSCQLMRMRLRYAHLRAPVATTVRSYASAMASQPKPMSSQLVM